MATTHELNLSQLLTLHKKHPCILQNPAIIPEGALVVCSSKGWKNAATDVEDFGQVLYFGEEVELEAPAGKNEHPDGKRGQVYVQSWDKTKRPNKDSLKSSFVFVCLLVCLLLNVCFVACNSYIKFVPPTSVLDRQWRLVG